MKCPVCEKQGKQSVLKIVRGPEPFPGKDDVYGFQEGDPVGRFWDEEGNFHWHALNQITTKYHCSKFHWVEIIERPKCPHESCNLGGDGSRRMYVIEGEDPEWKRWE